ncbi:N-acyl-D-amino-acid deacylase family protein [Rhabdothermincola salaria]|uniref:N-acyl-D-amino-acid deacylase family protein n=1 Tax=Rhabdothermincola salaria TaxID=2903142 RepID=UPI001E4B215E|nr:D-aminoacylase [Rhabdothermincola salaria]MCD9622965.1 D-aminoacylase [Rhabdothermincola salaria]
MTIDLVIRGGNVVDGTGGPGRRADVAVTDGRIVAVGPDLAADGAEVVDATGLVVAPGFIDIHTHYDAQVFWDPALTPSCFHGVTTVVAGNCGFSLAPTRPEHRRLVARTLENVEDMNVDTLEAGVPWDFSTFPEYLTAVERRGIGLNYAAYVGHTPLRLFVMGDDAYERAATDEEVAAMQEVLREALRAGAIGLATSFAVTHRGVDGKPVPSRLATREEFEALLDVMAEERRGAVAIAVGDPCPIPDMYDLQPKVGVPFTYTALLTMPTGSHDALQQLNREGWSRGAEVWPQVSPRPLAFAMTMVEPFTLNVNPAFADLMGRALVDRQRAYADPSWRAEARAAWAGATTFVPRWETFEIAESEARPDAVGRRLTDLADELGSDPFDLLLDMALAEPDLELRVRCILANDDTEAVARLLADEHCTLGLSDAGAHVGQLCDAPQATDFLGNWVRDRQLMPLEQAIHKLTQVQADLYGIPDRGVLAEGMWADVVVFDPATVDPGPVRRVRDFPADADRLTADQPVGIHHVVVNGTPIVRDGRRVDGDPLPGQLVASVPRAPR